MELSIIMAINLSHWWSLHLCLSSGCQGTYRDLPDKFLGWTCSLQAYLYPNKHVLSSTWWIYYGHHEYRKLSCSPGWPDWRNWFYLHRGMPIYLIWACIKVRLTWSSVVRQHSCYYLGNDFNCNKRKNLWIQPNI